MGHSNSAVPPAQPGRLGRNPDFLKLWAGQAISELGSHITGGGVPLLAILVLGATPFQMGLLAALGSLPVLILGLPAGVWVDRLRRRPAMIAADLGRAALLATIPAAALLGVLHIGQLYAVIILVGGLTVFFNVAYRAYLPALVERANLVEGNSKLAASSSAVEIVGPGLTGALVQAITAPVAILFDAISFLFSAASIAAIRKPELTPATAEERQPLLHELREGIQAVAYQPVLRALAGSLATREFFGSFFGVLYGLYAIRVLGLGPLALGITIGAGGVSSLVGALVAGRVVRRLGLGRTLIAMQLLGVLTSLLVPLAHGSVALATAFLVAAQLLGDALLTIYFINETSLRQALTPDRLLGRVNASSELLVAASGPLGALLGGFLGEAIGPRSTLFIAAFGGLCAALWLIASPVRHLREQPFPDSPPIAPNEPGISSDPLSLP